MISEKLLGVYACVMPLPPVEQAAWYKRVVNEWKIKTFEVPFFGSTPIATEVADLFAQEQVSLVATMVAQWGMKGQANVNYGLSSLDEPSRREALLDVQAAIQQCLLLSREGVTIRTLQTQTGQRVGSSIPHAIAFHDSLLEIGEALSEVLPDCELSVEVTDNLPMEHPIQFPGAKKSSLGLEELMDTVATVNDVAMGEGPISIVLNWGRLLVNGDRPLSIVQQVLNSNIRLGGVILSGAGATDDGFADSHNSHLDLDSGFTLDDGRACAEALKSSDEGPFLGMKCSKATKEGELSVERVLEAEAEFLSSL